MTLKVIVEAGEDFGFVVHAPALPGCWSQGTTRDEALANIREAISGWLETQQDKAAQGDAAADTELIQI